jgi:hypothetical protein
MLFRFRSLPDSTSYGSSLDSWRYFGACNACVQEIAAFVAVVRVRGPSKSASSNSLFGKDAVYL